VIVLKFIGIITLSKVLFVLFSIFFFSTELFLAKCSNFSTVFNAIFDKVKGTLTFWLNHIFDDVPIDEVTPFPYNIYSISHFVRLNDFRIRISIKKKMLCFTDIKKCFLFCFYIMVLLKDCHFFFTFYA
jgi:hypothetical protein